MKIICRETRNSRFNPWEAFCMPDSTKRASGTTYADAVGKLLFAMREELGVEVITYSYGRFPLKPAAEYGVKRIPAIGDVIYVGGSDDHCGGKGIVCLLDEMISAGKPAPVVYVEGVSSGFNWKMLEEEQDRLKESYGDRIAEDDYVAE